MKKFFLMVGTILFFCSCTDLSVNEEEAIYRELPNDFDWQEYANINNDVKASQIVFKIQEEKKAYSGKMDSIENCSGALSNMNTAQLIYTRYVGCPSEFNNIDGCYNESWDLLINDNRCIDSVKAVWEEEGENWEDNPEFEIEISIKCPTNPNPLQYYLKNFRENLPTTFNPTIKMMCLFISPYAEGSPEKAEGYLNELKLDSTLVKQHYFLIGRREGRPYKKCEDNEFDETKEKNLELAVKSESVTGGNTIISYNYSRYTFCLKNDKLYVVTN